MAIPTIVRAATAVVGLALLTACADTEAFRTAKTNPIEYGPPPGTYHVDPYPPPAGQTHVYPYPPPAPAYQAPPLPSPPPDQDASSGQPTVTAAEIALIRHGDTFYVPVTINDSIQLSFLIDSGASDVSIPADVVMTLMRMGTITSGDFLGKRTYQLADGSTAPSTIFRIKSLKVGDITLQNVVGSIAPVQGGLLLGQSFLSHFRSWSINNDRRVLSLE